MTAMKKKSEEHHTESSQKRARSSQTKKSENTSKEQSSAKKTSFNVGYEDWEDVEEECKEYQRELFCKIHDHLSLSESSIHAAFSKIEALASLEATKFFHKDLDVLRSFVGDSNSSRVAIDNLIRKLEEMECE